MTASKKLRVLALVTTGLANLAAPISATANTTRLAAFIWQDETVYRPDCPSNDRERRSFPSSICDDKRCWQ